MIFLFWDILPPYPPSMGFSSEKRFAMKRSVDSLILDKKVPMGKRTKAEKSELALASLSSYAFWPSFASSFLLFSCFPLFWVGNQLRMMADEHRRRGKRHSPAAERRDE